MDAKDPRAAQVIGFWFGSGDRDKRWFEKNAAFDEQVRKRFLALHEQAAAAKLAHWKNEPAECLALIVLLDQFPRNMFRGTARAFATDSLALEAARHAVAKGFDRAMRPVGRMFCPTSTPSRWRSSFAAASSPRRSPALRKRRTSTATPRYTATSSSASAVFPIATQSSGARVRRRKSSF